jgi:hypothetical protein
MFVRTRIALIPTPAGQTWPGPPGSALFSMKGEGEALHHTSLCHTTTPRPILCLPQWSAGLHMLTDVSLQAIPCRLFHDPLHREWHRPGLLLQSIGGSLRLPLFQNGACPFPCTPLLSGLMLVTHTDREVLTMFPGLRIMAVSM